MARSRSFAHSVALGILGQAITMVAGLWLSPFLLRHIGPSGYGLWIVGQQVLVYLTLMDFGVIALLPRETAYVRRREGSALELPKLFAGTARIVLWQTPVVAAAAAALWLLLPATWSGVRAPIGLASVAFIALFPFRIFRGLLEGLQDLAFISWSYMAGWFAGLVVSVALVQAGFGLRALAIGWAANQALDTICCLIRLRFRFPEVWPEVWTADDWSGTLSQFSRGLWVSLSQIAQVLIYGTDAAVIGRLFGPAAVVPYNCTGKLINALANQPQHVMRAAAPGLSEMRVAADRRHLASVTGALSLAMLLASGAVTALTLAVNPAFVRWWIGEAYFGGIVLTVLFAVSMLLRHLNITAIYTLLAFGQERLLAVTALADGILSTIFSILFAWALHSAIGVVLGSILSTCCVLFLGNGPKLTRELGVSTFAVGKPLGGWFWRMLLAGTAACLLGAKFANAGPFGMACLGAATLAGYALLMLPVALGSSLGPYLEPYLKPIRTLRFRRTEHWAH